MFDKIIFKIIGTKKQLQIAVFFRTILEVKDGLHSFDRYYAIVVCADKLTRCFVPEFLYVQRTFVHTISI